MLRYLLPLMSAILLFGFWSCFSKKPAKPSLREYIDQTFDGEIRYLSAVTDLDPKRLLTLEKPILLADGKDSLVQLFATAVTSAPDYGLDADALRATLQIRRKEKRQAEGLYADLAAAGMPDVSVAMLEGHCYVLVYADATPENRETFASRILAVMHNQQYVVPVRLWVEWMEPAVLRQETGPVVPFGYWHRGDTYHTRHRHVMGAVDWNDDITPGDLSKTWSTNTESDRMSRYADKAFAAAQAWTGKDKSRPGDFTRDSYLIWGDEDHPLKVHFAFPRAGESPDNQSEQPEGYVTGLYDPDTHTFAEIRMTDSL